MSQRRFKKSDEIQDVSVLDLGVILMNVFRAAQDPELGYQDIDIDLPTILTRTNRSFTIDRDSLERVLWASNMINETGGWWHPKGLTFSQFIDKLLGKTAYQYNRDYGWLDRYKGGYDEDDGL